MKHPTRVVALFGLTLLTTSCSLGLERDAPARARFLVVAPRPADSPPPDAASSDAVASDAPRVATPAPAPNDARLEVRAFHAASPYASSRFVYRVEDARYETDFYREFVVPPEQMLAELTRSWLADARVASVVLGPASRTAPTHALEADVTTIAADFRDPETARAVVALRVFVVRLPDTVLMQRTYEQSEPLPDRSADKLADALGRAFARLLAELEADVAAQLANDR